MFYLKRDVSISFGSLGECSKNKIIVINTRPFDYLFVYMYSSRLYENNHPHEFDNNPKWGGGVIYIYK